jgi:putative ABC transport system ATP-binding protein
MIQAIIQVRDLARSYHMGAMAVEALRGVSFEIQAGEFVAIMGPSGSGKTTLMNLLGCLDTPTAGHYSLDGTPVERLEKDQLAAARNRTIGFVFQQFNLLPRNTALANVELPLIYGGERDRAARREQAAQSLARVGLADRSEHRPRELSGGQQQRVAIARALVSEPRVLLADEPTGNLDSRSSSEIIQLFGQLNAQGITIILVTHEPEVARAARRVLTIRDGLLAGDSSSLNDQGQKANDERQASCD